MSLLKFKDKDIQNILEEELVQRENINSKNNLPFKYSINIKENILNLDIYNYLDLAIRNNKKRRFLFVSKVLGKHLPCRACDMDNLGKDIVKVYEKKQDYLNSGVVISFAETGTALGHSVFNYINADYEFIHTTREKVENKESLHFLEEHSHATNHNLYYEDLKYLKDKEEIILVDDEITTGNTCINLIKKINELFPKKRYTICSILNWMNDEAFDRFKKLEQEVNCKINFVYLFSGDFEFKCDEEKVEDIIKCSENKENTILKNKDLRISYTYIDMKKYEHNKKYLKYTGRFGINKEDQKNLLDTVKKESFKFSIDYDEKILFLGTEEFMYIPMLFAKQFEDKDVYYHSTTRSPIVEFDKEGYPIKSKFIHNSIYNKNIVNYIYNIDKYDYDKCFLFCEFDKEEKEFKEIINVFSNTSIKELNIVMFK